MQKYYYLFWLGLFIVGPTSALWLCYYAYFQQHLRIFAVNFCVVSLGVLLDLLGVYNGFWTFRGPHNLGIYFFSLPLEEWFTYGLFSIFATSLVLLSIKAADRK